MIKLLYVLTFFFCLSGFADEGKDHLPQADLKLNLLKTKHYAPMPVELDASKSSGKKGATIVKYEFDFGDSSGVVQQSSPIVKHTYEILSDVKIKKFVPQIRVQDSNGNWSEANKKTLELKQIPDPGEAGKKTVAGIDLDENGIRDDIDRLINFEYKELTVLQRQSLRQYAEFIQKELVNYRDKNFIIDLYKNDRAGECTTARFGVEPSHKIQKKIEIAYVNTDERSHADAEVEKHLGGIIIEYNTRPSDYITKCKDNN